MRENPSVAIIVLNWNGRDDTLACLSSLFALDYSSRIVIVIDNGSSDGSAHAIRAQYPEVCLIENQKNLGFVEGNNVGIKRAKRYGADYAFLLNNDTIVAPETLDRLVEVVERYPNAGALGPTIYYFDQPEIIWSAGGAIDWNRGSTQMLGLDELEQGQFGADPRKVDFVTGCAMLIRMSTFDRVGELDSRFFAYYEETEWCVRAARAGYEILHVPTAKVWHKISPSEQVKSPVVHYYMTRNRLLFLKSTNAKLSAWINTLFGEYLWILLNWSLRPKWRDMRGQRDVMVKAICDYFKGRFGQTDVTV